MDKELVAEWFRFADDDIDTAVIEKLKGECAAGK